MANQKLTALTENESPALVDLLYSVDDPSGSPLSRKVTLQNVMNLFQSQMSHVFARTDAGQDIVSNTTTTIVYGTEIRDTLGEFNTSTGVFTATYAGYYLVNAGITYESTEVWSALNQIYGYVYVEESPQCQNYWRVYVSTDQRITTPPLCVVVYAGAGEDITIRTRHDNPANRALENIDFMNYLTIDRIM